MIYLDNAATTPLDEDILELMLPYLKGAFGNASSQHAYGRTTANAVISARDTIAKIMGVPAGDIYFTAGGTESANTAIKGVCLANSQKGKHILVSAIEHPCVLESARDLQKLGFVVDYVQPNGEGIVSAQSVAEAIRQDTVLVAVMSANNEIGAVQPIKDIYQVCKQKGVFFYCDCVQTAGVLDFANFPADGIGISAHKFYGPKGVGVLYIKNGTHFSRLLSGGHQEKGMRGGTTNTAGIVGCASALKKAVNNASENNAKVTALRDRFIDRVLAEIDGTHLNGGMNSRLPANANISFDGCDGENILFLLDLKGIAVSTGSACSSGAVTPSHVLKAMGLSDDSAKSAVRFTFGKYNTEQQVDEVVEALKQVVEKIRKK
jgi:cysteine desulfurase